MFPTVIGGGYLVALPVLVFLVVISTVQGQQDEGFINIDCGSSKNYTNTKTKLKYVTESPFIDTGEKHKLTNLSYNSYASHFYSLRSFPNGRRNCYGLPAHKGSKYMIKAYFLYANYDGLNNSPKFDLYVGVNFWETVSNRDIDLYYIYNMMTVASASSVSVCLVNTNSGTPFITALELRPLNDVIYPGVNASHMFYSAYRGNIGSDSMLRYPDDIYDRIWFPYRGRDGTKMTSLTTSESIEMRDREFEPPIGVIKTCGFPESGSRIDIQWSTSSYNFFVIFYFAELQMLNLTTSRVFNIRLNDRHLYGPFQPEYLKLTTIKGHMTTQRNGQYSISITKATGSTLPPILNAFEIHIIKPITELATAGENVDAMMDIKTYYQVKKNWMGDPCAPEELVWEGLICTENTLNLKVVALNISSSKLKGDIHTAFGKILDLEHLDLSNNELSGSLPDFLSELSNLKYLNLSNNMLSGMVPEKLLEKSAARTLILSIDGNPDLCIDPNQCRKTETKKPTKTMIIIISVICSFLVLAFAIALFIAWKVTAYPTLATDQDRHNHMPLPFPPSPPSDDSHLKKIKQFTYGDLVRVTRSFIKEIGVGGFGKVFYGVLDNGMQVAVKRLANLSPQGSQQFETELQLLQRINHKNLVPLVGYCNENDNLALVYEYMAEGSLGDHLSGKRNKNTTIRWGKRLTIAIEAAQGLDYLHRGCKPPIVHRDVKSSNILLSNDMEAMVADFGWSKIFENDATFIFTRVVGTNGYIDPEYQRTQKLNEKSDVYSFGIVLLEILTGRPALITKEEENSHIVSWVEQRINGGEICDIVDPKIRGECDTMSARKVLNIAHMCLKSKPTKRPFMHVVVSALEECSQDHKTTCEVRASSTSTTEINQSHKSVTGSSIGMDMMIGNEFTR